MKTVLAALALMGVLAGSQAQALPLPSAPAASTESAAITLVRAGCGFGAHRGPFGGCRLNRGPRGAIRGALGFGPRRVCPPGMHRGFRGVCRPNFR